jgi:carboxyl-terminal processing protease
VKQEGQIKVGYISLNEFSSHASEQMQRAILNLNEQNVDAYVLDLRGNPGGLLHASVEIARMWIESGEIVHTVDRKGGTQEFKANNSALTQLPLAVLVDGNSASASEILAGALKDSKRRKQNLWESRCAVCPFFIGWFRLSGNNFSLLPP